MKPALAFNLYQTSRSNGPAGKAMTPENVGENQFRAFLKKVNKNALSAFAFNLYQTSRSDVPAGKAMTPENVGENLFRAFLKKEGKNALAEKKGSKEPGGNGISLSGLPLQGLKFGPGAEGKLKAFLRSEGLTDAQSTTLIGAAGNKDGLIRLDRLQMGLTALVRANGGREKDTVISAGDVPRFQGVLFKMGLGTEEVKSLVEKAKDGEGNLFIDKMMPDLSRKFPEIDSKKALVRYLVQSDIQLQDREGDLSSKIPELRPFLENYAETPSEDVRKTIKARLADLLRKEGVPPQKVKSFLEGMNVTYAEKASRVEAAKEGKSAAAAEIGLWDGLVLKPQGSLKKDGWTEKILAILKGAGNGVRKGDREEGGFPNPNLSDLLEKEGIGKGRSNEKIISILDGEETGQSVEGTGKATKSKAGKERQTLVTGQTSPGFPDQNGKLEKVDPAARGTQDFGRMLKPSQEAASLSKLLDRMQWMVEAGRQRARIRLSPPELGQIELRLVVEQGHLHAHLGTDNPMVKEMIEANLAQLRQQLSDLGFVVEEFQVLVGQDHPGFAEGGEPWGHNGGMADSDWNGKPDIESVSEASATPGSIGDDRYQINVRV